MPPKLLTIIGPTASGKTSLSIQLAKKFHGEIISADSRQIYRGMTIGTAKPLRDQVAGGKIQAPNSKFQINSRSQITKKQTGTVPSTFHIPQLRQGFAGRAHSTFFSQNIPHYLIDIRSPDQDYSVADFQQDAFQVIDDILSRGKLPILAGGTGLYIQAVVDNLDIPRTSANPALRKKLEEELYLSDSSDLSGKSDRSDKTDRSYETNKAKYPGLPKLFQQLVKLDPEAAYIVDPQNPRRVIRALEVALTTGRPFTEARKKRAPRYNTLTLGITRPTEELRKRIDQRIHEMYADGLTKEVEKLVKKYGENCKALDAIGYREVIAYLDGKISLEGSIRQMELNTWHYAKRQLTWFKKYAKAHWIQNRAEAEKLVSAFLSLS